jgi:hypothetical protein
LTSRVGAAGASSLDRLRTSAFIPVKTEKDVLLYKPSEVYFAKRENTNDLYGSAFTFVDFGEKANTFLQYCGVKSEPSVRGESYAIHENLADGRYRLVTYSRTGANTTSSWLAGKVSHVEVIWLISGIFSNYDSWLPIGSTLIIRPGQP